jgi:predicted deacylase/glutamine amidotransferase-like uncharacterized protein
MKLQPNLTKLRWIVAVLFVSIITSNTLSNAQSNENLLTPSKISNGLLGEGTNWSMSWRVVESGTPGPTVVVLGGIHGNEPAGYRAATQIQEWPIVAGKLVVLPCVNRLGTAANMRWFPEFRNDKKLRDMNRNFPMNERLDPRTPLADAVWQFVKQQDPDWVFDLHEGFDFHRENAKSVGSSVISFPEYSEFGKLLQRTVNTDIPAKRQFVLLDQKGPVAGSLARACRERLEAKSFILETTFKDQAVSTRTRQHRQMVSAAFRAIGITDKDCVDNLAPPKPTAQTRVAIFDGNGTSEANLVRLLDRQPNIYATQIGPRDLKAEVLTQFDIVLLPGGSGGKQGRDMKETGRDSIRQFVHQGGGVVGICAGAYLCSSHYDWSLDLFNASVFNQTVDVPEVGKKSMWYRGKPADVEVELTTKGETIFGPSPVKLVRYHNGPILSPGDQPSSPTYETLAMFRSEVSLYEAQKNTMVNTPAIVTSRFGQGRVIAISPHFESTPGQENKVLAAIEYVRRQRQERKPDTSAVTNDE